MQNFLEFRYYYLFCQYVLSCAFAFAKDKAKIGKILNKEGKGWKKHMSF